MTGTPVAVPARLAAVRPSELGARCTVGALLALAAVLDLLHLSRNGWADTDYAAAVRSMNHSWRNVVFVAFDHGGLEPVNGVFPLAGPSFVSAGGVGGGRRGAASFGGGFGGSTELGSTLAWVEAHGATSRFPLVVASDEEAAAAVVAGEPVASLGGFSGRETVLGATRLASLVRAGEARSFLLGGGSAFGGPGGSTANAGAEAVESACTAVEDTTVDDTASGSTAATLYDCAGKAAALARGG